MVKYKFSFIIAFSALITINSAYYGLAASIDTTEEQKLIEEENRRELKDIPIKPPVKEKVFSLRYGGWFTTLFRDYADLDNDAGVKDLTSWILTEDLRLWSQINYNNEYILYARLKHLYTRRDISSLSTNYRSDYDGPHLDMAYLNINKPKWKVPVDLTVGRQYLFIGRGIAYSDVNYGVKFKTNIGRKAYIKSFISQSDENEDNIDESVPNYKKTGSRLFAGAELAYSGLKDNLIYGFVLIQKDKNPRFPPETPTQSYRYNSEYYGLGLQSINPKSKLSYWLEAINEQGKSHTDTASVDLDEKNINAWAVDAGLNYKINLPLKPGFEFEYAYGSGDKDRTSVTDTRSGGNLYGDDTNFLYFGSFFSGYALAPRLSNLHIYKLDFSLRPFEKIKLWKNIVCGVKYFKYRKDKKSGGIYDTEATLSSLDVGQEADAYFYWQVKKNIYWSSRFGIFLPGDAYPSTTNDNTKYFYSRLMITF
ncbi:MAG: alginate export family protein [Candidatus Omnitrophota bacterium]